jgi:hypothetical protein
VSNGSSSADRSALVLFELDRRARAANAVLRRGEAKIDFAPAIDDAWTSAWVGIALSQIADGVLPAVPFMTEHAVRDWADARGIPVRTRTERLEARRFLAWEYAAVAGCVEAHLEWIQPH